MNRGLLDRMTDDPTQQAVSDACWITGSTSFGTFSPTSHPAPVRRPAVPTVYLLEDDESSRMEMRGALLAAGYEVRAFPSIVDFLLTRRDSMLECLVMDVQIPGGPSGLDLQKALNQQGDTLPLIFIAGDGDISVTVQAIKNGAFDFLPNPVDPAVLLTSVRNAFASQEIILARADLRRSLASRLGSLTPQEYEVFIRVVNGEMNKCIATDLDCSERTVKARRSQVMIKMGAGSFAHLVSLAKEVLP